MIKKNHLLPLTRPGTTMRRVLSAVEIGLHYKHDMISATGLTRGQVSSALYNLRFIGAIHRAKDGNGRNFYYVEGMLQAPVASCWRGASSAFTPLPD